MLDVDTSLAEGANIVAQKLRATAVQAYHSTVDVAVGVVQTLGGALTHLREKFLSGTGSDTAASVSDPASTPLVLGPAFSIGFDLYTSPGPQLPPGIGGKSSVRPMDPGTAAPTNMPAYVWLTLTVPTNAATLSFDFILHRNEGSDSLAAGINGTNIFSLATRFMPVAVPLNSGTLNVSGYAGQTVEMFFGVVGGTSTNASVTVDGIRFFQLIPPALQVAQAGNQATIAWPISAPGFILESAANLSGSNPWAAVTNAFGVADFQYTLTNDASGGARFYRLRKP